MMTDERDQDSTGKQGQPGAEQTEPKSGAGYGDHAEELLKSETPAVGDEKST